MNLGRDCSTKPSRDAEAELMLDDRKAIAMRDEVDRLAFAWFDFVRACGDPLLHGYSLESVGPVPFTGSSPIEYSD
jgi:hypothetical protein